MGSHRLTDTEVASVEEHEVLPLIPATSTIQPRAQSIPGPGKMLVSAPRCCEYGYPCGVLVAGTIESICGPQGENILKEFQMQRLSGTLGVSLG